MAWIKHPDEREAYWIDWTSRLVGDEAIGSPIGRIYSQETNADVTAQFVETAATDVVIDADDAKKVMFVLKKASAGHQVLGSYFVECEVTVGTQTRIERAILDVRKL